MFFSKTTEVTKTVLPKVLQNFRKTPNCTCWPKELNQKGFPCNIQYRTRLKGPLHFFGVLRQNGRWKIPKGAPFSFFRHLRLFSKTFFGSVEENTLTLWSPFAIFEPRYGADLGRSRLLKLNNLISVLQKVEFFILCGFYNVGSRNFWNSFWNSCKVQ